MRSCELIVAGLVGWLSCAGCGSEAPEKEKGENDKGKAKTISLFDGDTLGKWKSIDFNGEGDVHVSFDGWLTLEQGAPLTGVVWTDAAEEVPRTNYEIYLEGKKLHGTDFFCALTFPVSEDYATFICGGWGGTVLGISNIDGEDAVRNETTKEFEFEKDRWYTIRVRVTEERMAGWIDGEKMFDVELKGKSISLRPGQIELCKPLGIASFDTRSAFRKIELRRLGK